MSKGIVLHGVSPEVKRRLAEFEDWIATPEGKAKWEKEMQEYWERVRKIFANQRPRCPDPFCPFCKPELYEPLPTRLPPPVTRRS